MSSSGQMKVTIKILQPYTEINSPRFLTSEIQTFHSILLLQNAISLRRAFDSYMFTLLHCKRIKSHHMKNTIDFMLSIYVRGRKKGSNIVLFILYLVCDYFSIKLYPGQYAEIENLIKHI